MEAPVLTPDCTLPDDPDVLKGMIRELAAQLHDTNRELDGVRQRLDALLQRLYGPKSERFRPGEPTLFDELLAAEPTTTAAEQLPAPPADEPTPSATPQRRSKHGRQRLPADLERKRREYDVPQAEKICPCCHKPRVRIGEEVSEQLDYQPAQAIVWQHVRFKYACPACLAQAGDALPSAPDTPALIPCDEATATQAVPGVEEPEASRPPLIVTAPKPPQPIDKGLPGPGLLAFVITNKYADHLPLYRQEGILARHGIELSRSTLCDWMAATAKLLGPLYDCMLHEVLRSRVINTDETRVPVQEEGQERTKSGRLWVYSGDGNHPQVVYDYTPTKQGTGPATILAEYSGFVQADAANVFDGIYLPGTITEVGCWAHGRRYFHEARTSDAVRAAEALARIAAFYAVEDEAAAAIARAKLSGAAADAVRLRLRQEKTAPQLAAFAAWLEEQARLVLPKSPLGQAIAYAQRHWQALVRFTEHGFLNIDNNAAERALRAVALGRKNWLFAGSDQGGHTAAVLYTMTQTCKRHQVDPFAYLRDVLTRLPGQAAERLEELLPQRWAQAQRQALAASRERPPPEPANDNSTS
jgi:transposase